MNKGEAAREVKILAVFAVAVVVFMAATTEVGYLMDRFGQPQVITVYVTQGR